VHINLAALPVNHVNQAASKTMFVA
jgi:hypothetical protein